MRFPDDFVDKVVLGDSLEVLKEIPDNVIDTIITDPPYGLAFMDKEWDDFGTDLQKYQEWTRCWAKEVLRIAKPGAILLAFGGTRTWHRLACGLEDAGWEIRDTLMWLYGSGFPKSLNIGKAVDKLQGNERIVVGRYVDPNGVEYRQTGHRKNFTAGNADEVENCSDDRFILTKGFSNWEGYGTALKPAYEPIILAMKPLDGTFAENALKWGVAGLNIDGARIGTEKVLAHHSPAGTFAGGEPNRGSDTNYYVNQGRFPANLLLDEVSAEILDEQIGISKSTIRLSEDKDIQRSTWSLNRKGVTPRGHNDVGGASRFFYVAKASRSERDAGLDEFPERQLRDDFGIERFNTSNIKNNHPTVKPIKLMNYLVKLTKMPNPNQIYLDPFLGSGTTAIAVVLNRRHFIGIEKEPEYVEVAKKRIEYWSSKANQTFEFEEGNG